MTSGRKMNEASTAADKHIDRRIVLKAGVALATAGPVILRGAHAEAQPRATALFAYVGAFTTPERNRIPDITGRPVSSAFAIAGRFASGAGSALAWGLGGEWW